MNVASKAYHAISSQHLRKTENLTPVPPPPPPCALDRLSQDADYEDPVPFITKAHFEEAMSRARRSVSESDIRKYDAFNQNMKAARGFDDFKFGDEAGAEGGKEGEGEDDLYGAP
jgi:hypothetical protein